MSLKLYFLRHGQTAFSRANDFCGAGMDPGLTDEGLEMARQFAAAYKSTTWQAVYCSTLQRAILTAQPMCEALGLEIHKREGLKEIAYGAWEGQTVEAVARDHHDDYIRWTADPAWHAPTGGEAATAIAHRVLQVIGEIQASHKDGNVLVVSHKATIRIALCSLLGIDVGRFRYRLGCPVAGVSIVEFGAHGPLLHALADRTHLDETLRTAAGT